MLEISGKSYGDYCDEGKPYGKTGFVKWIHEQYEKDLTPLLQELDTLRTLEGTVKRLIEEMIVG